MQITFSSARSIIYCANGTAIMLKDVVFLDSSKQVDWLTPVAELLARTPCALPRILVYSTFNAGSKVSAVL